MHESLSDKLTQLEQKFAAMGQDMASYLEGLLQADYLTYWDYVHLDTLLSLQTPKTAYPDELIFVTYHQITELYFKLVLHEIAQIAEAQPLTPAFFTARMQRVNRYFDLLEQSFGVMIAGMEREQFLKFRMALLPSSGFQSVQFREIEIVSTDFQQLLADAPAEPGSIADRYDLIYWKQGATELATQQKTLTLNQFDRQYSGRLVRLAEIYQTKNLHKRLQELEQTGQLTTELADVLREYDHRVNVRWKLAHLRSAVQYLHKTPTDIKATGGTNWQTYLPPVQQQRIFFPALWSAEALQHWGRPSLQT
ncbi:tryptophan 2,3-dioxygenase family protein [Spirosoma utsteinense]|uniref:Tryptophan 2,3-dioxygenase n=1 Tax=Spirosoma utsteinense TaxID=2585773 RepID=A0ABR6W1Q7_9BACT|nr:tryptophan 2,3-dioxygenase family protein [Spirosoma utsteinense]MBC3788161.1 tryptophan 2,3-dioxygenase [Spirosoma utsteinense]MBC3790490.1 tryptophan 2,3-dioxygenase [Spirosoma utsteinense]